jgi:hypothetical protein
MALDEVISRLSKYCDVRKLDDTEDRSSWFVSEKGSGARGAFRLIASLGFRKGKLTSVFKSWDGSDIQRQIGMATSIYGALSTFVREGRTSCSIDASQKSTPSSESQSAFISCGDKYIRIDIIDIKSGEAQGKTASIVEVLEDQVQP